jgi:hypothetical protein
MFGIGRDNGEGRKRDGAVYTIYGYACQFSVYVGKYLESMALEETKPDAPFFRSFLLGRPVASVS